jgi:hypothetical protein
MDASPKMVPANGHDECGRPTTLGGAELLFPVPTTASATIRVCGHYKRV